MDRFELAGTVAAWWGETQYDIKALALNGFEGVVEGWLTTIESAFALDEEEAEYWDKQKIAAEKRKARDHRVVPALIPEYLAELEEAEARYAELNAQYKVATAKPSEEDEEADEPETQLSAAELKQLKSDVTAARRTAGDLEAAFIPRLFEAANALTDDTRLGLVLDVFHTALAIRLGSRTVIGRRVLEGAFRTWVDKYAVTLRELESQREIAVTRLGSYLKELGYE
ncbi:hypothetical protein ACFQX6_18115 [Streptosporangium lutulentum]